MNIFLKILYNLLKLIQILNFALIPIAICGTFIFLMLFGENAKGFSDYYLLIKPIVITFMIIIIGIMSTFETMKLINNILLSKQIKLYQWIFFWVFNIYIIFVFNCIKFIVINI